MYVITLLIEQVLKNRNWRKKDLLLGMGYKNLGRGMRRLDACLSKGDCSNREFMSRLRLALDISPAVLEETTEQTRRQVEENNRQRRIQEELDRRLSFRPYVFVKTEQERPSSITAAAVIGPRLKHLQLNETVLIRSRREQIAQVAEIIRQHFTDNFGRCLLYGSIVGYTFRIGYDETIEYDPAGMILREQSGCYREHGETYLLVKHTPVKSGLFSELG